MSALLIDDSSSAERILSVSFLLTVCSVPTSLYAFLTYCCVMVEAPWLVALPPPRHESKFAFSARAMP